MKLIAFVAPSWCEPCKWMRANNVLPRLKEKHPEITVEVVDLSRDNRVKQDRADEFNVRGVPAFRVVDEDERVLVSASGAMDVAQLEALLARAGGRRHKR